MDVIQKLSALSCEIHNTQTLQKEIQSTLKLSMGQTLDKRLANNAIALVCEANEVLNETNWRPWRDPKELDKAALIEELADCFLFMLNILNELDIPFSHFQKVVRSKQVKNVQRYGKS